jgi:hypothetical protein
MEVMRKENASVYIELGSGRVLSGLVKRIGRDWPEAPTVFNVDDMISLEKTKRALFEL